MSRVSRAHSDQYEEMKNIPFELEVRTDDEWYIVTHEVHNRLIETYIFYCQWSVWP